MTVTCLFRFLKIFKEKLLCTKQSPQTIPDNWNSGCNTHIGHWLRCSQAGVRAWLLPTSINVWSVNLAANLYFIHIFYPEENILCLFLSLFWPEDNSLPPFPPHLALSHLPCTCIFWFKCVCVYVCVCVGQAKWLINPRVCAPLLLWLNILITKQSADMQKHVCG